MFGLCSVMLGPQLQDQKAGGWRVVWGFLLSHGQRGCSRLLGAGREAVVMNGEGPLSHGGTILRLARMARKEDLHLSYHVNIYDM